MSSFFPSSSSIKLSNSFVVTADMTSATWNTVAQHEIAAVTGLNYVTVIANCTSTLTDAADGALISFGVKGAISSLIGAIGAAGNGGNTINTGEFWVDNTPTDLRATKVQMDSMSFVVGNGTDIGYEITGAALTGGTIVFYVWWEPLEPTASVAPGNGGVL